MCFKTTLQCAFNTGLTTGQVTNEQFLAASDAIDNCPEFLAEAEKHARRIGAHVGVNVPDCCDPADVASGKVAAPNWTNLLAFIQTLLPLILTIIQMFNPPKPPTPPVPVPPAP